MACRRIGATINRPQETRRCVGAALQDAKPGAKAADGVPYTLRTSRGEEYRRGAHRRRRRLRRECCAPVDDCTSNGQKDAMQIVWTIIIGFVAGVIAKLLHPGSK